MTEFLENEPLTPALHSLELSQSEHEAQQRNVRAQNIPVLFRLMSRCGRMFPYLVVQFINLVAQALLHLLAALRVVQWESVGEHLVLIDRYCTEMSSAAQTVVRTAYEECGAVLVQHVGGFLSAHRHHLWEVLLVLIGSFFMPFNLTSIFLLALLYCMPSLVRLVVRVRTRHMEISGKLIPKSFETLDKLIDDSEVISTDGENEYILDVAKPGMSVPEIKQGTKELMAKYWVRLARKARTKFLTFEKDSMEQRHVVKVWMVEQARKEYVREAHIHQWIAKAVLWAFTPSQSEIDTAILDRSEAVKKRRDHWERGLRKARLWRTVASELLPEGWVDPNPPVVLGPRRQEN